MPSLFSVILIPFLENETTLAICQRGLKTSDTGNNTVAPLEGGWTTDHKIYLGSWTPVTSFMLMLVSQVAQGLERKEIIYRKKKIHIIK